MKARIKRTGEVVEVVQTKPGVYIDEEHRTFYVESLDFILDEEKHWQDIRERAAIAAIQGMLSCGEGAFSYQGITDEIAKAAVDYADSLIEELKKEIRL